MHSLNLLTRAVPEFETINLLVLRDLYHRYTVDEHTFLAIDVLHRLRNNAVDWLQPFAELLSELERPELLFLALLLHDTGKGLEGADHVQSSLQLATAAVRRMQLSDEDAQTVRFLVGGSSGDFFHPAPARHLRSGDRPRTGGKNRYARAAEDADADDAGRHQGGESGGADALESRKSLAPVYGNGNLFRFAAADKERLHAEVSNQPAEKVAALLPAGREELLQFLDGLPQRYLLSHSPEQVAKHFTMASHLAAEPVQLGLRDTSGQQELTLVTSDRPGLFRTVTGILYGWGMDITKAAAFSNHAGVVVDSFYFKDRFRTLELNPPERERFKRSVREILMGEAWLEPLLESRLKADQRPVKLTVETRLRYDDECSSRSTLLEVVTQDRPGLLHTISSTLTSEECSIEIALIDTEGPVAHDVFYITCHGNKLTPERMRSIEWALATELGDAFPNGW